MQSSLKRKVVEIGFIAAARGWEKETRAIFQGVKDLCPDSPAPYLGMAFASMGQNRYEAAVDILKKGLEVMPEQKEISLFLGLAYHLKKESEQSRELLEKFAQSNTAIGRMAACLLSEQEGE